MLEGICLFDATGTVNDFVWHFIILQENKIKVAISTG